MEIQKWNIWKVMGQVAAVCSVIVAFLEFINLDTLKEMHIEEMFLNCS